MECIYAVFLARRQNARFFSEAPRQALGLGVSGSALMDDRHLDLHPSEHGKSEDFGHSKPQHIPPPDCFLRHMSIRHANLLQTLNPKPSSPNPKSLNPFPWQKPSLPLCLRSGPADCGSRSIPGLAPISRSEPCNPLPLTLTLGILYWGLGFRAEGIINNIQGL